MTYDYQCTKCGFKCERSVPIAKRDDIQLCPCGLGENMTRIFESAPPVVSGHETIQKRAGSGWNDTLKRIKKASGRHNTIQTA